MDELLQLGLAGHERRPGEQVGGGQRHGAAAGSARDGGHQNQLVDPFGVGEGQLLGDHAAKAGAKDAGLLDVGVVQDRENIVGHHPGRVVPRRGVGGADAAVVDGDDLEAASQPVGHWLPTPAANAHPLDQDQRRPAAPEVVGQGHRAVAGKAGRAHTGCARQAQPDRRTMPQAVAELAEGRCNCGPGPARSVPDLGRPLPSTGSDHVAFLSWFLVPIVVRRLGRPHGGGRLGPLRRCSCSGPD